MDQPSLSPWKGAVAGGLIVFLWSSLSWMVLPFHEKTVGKLTDAAPIVAALQGAPSGVYILPNDPTGQMAPTDPFLFVSYEKKGWGPMGPSMLAALVIQCVGAFFWTWILGKMPSLTPKSAALYGAMFGLCVGVLAYLPNTVWWKFSPAFTLLYLVDAVVAWAAASAVVARWCR